MKLAIQKASINVPVYIFIQDSSSTTGAGLTGLVYNSAGLVCYYVRPLAAAAALTLATQTVTGAHSDGGFVEVSAANMPGVYRLDLSDAILATGVDSVVVELKGATNMAPLPLEIQLTSLDLNDAVRGGMTALPNAVADGAGGLPISDGGGLDIDTILGRITANVALASVCTEVRLAELAAANLPADVDTMLTRLSAVRAGYLDNLSAGAVALASALATAQSDLDILTGTNGVTLATSQPNYAPNTVVPDAAGVAPTAVEIRQEMDTNSVDLNQIQADIAALNDLSTTDILTQVNAALDTAISELGVAVPAATPTLRTGLMLMYMALRNRTDVQTSGADALEIRNNAGTIITQKLLTDDGSDYSEAKMS